MAKNKDKTPTGSAFEWPLIKRLLSYIRPYLGYFIFGLGLTVILSILGPAVPYLFQRILDEPVAQGDQQGLLNGILIVIGIMTARALFAYINTYLMNWLGQSVIRDLRTKVFNHITSLRLKFFDHTPVGTLQTRAISDVETLNNVFSDGIVQILGEILQLIAILVIMFFTSWRLTLVALVTLPILIWATVIFKNKIKVAFQGVRKYVSSINAFLQEHITGMMVTQIFSREKVEMEKFKGLNEKLETANLDSVLYYSVYFPAVEIISALGLALLVWFGTGNVLNDTITFGMLVAFIMYIAMFFRPLRMLADRFNTLQLGMVSAERIFKILDTTEVIDNDGTTPAVDIDKKQLELEFDRVSFAYNDQDWVLNDVSFKVGRGQKVAIVGSTGAGKSTIINLLSRFYEINRGHIRVEGTDISHFDKAQLRSMIGIVLQDVFLFSGSVHENITINNAEVTREQVVAAAKMVGAHEFIEKLPGGYDYDVQERGATLSAGQRQLIAFARVLVYDPRILVLDEATSNIDTESEEMIQTAIEKVMHGRTSIIIAHRLSTIQKADLILVMDKGRVIESGNHQELLGINGLYKRLYALQFQHT